MDAAAAKTTGGRAIPGGARNPTVAESHASNGSQIYAAFNRLDEAHQLAIVREMVRKRGHSKLVPMLLGELQRVVAAAKAGGAHQPVTNTSEPDDAAPAAHIFDKYSGGYEGSFADISAFFGGLDHLIGEPE